VKVESAARYGGSLVVLAVALWAADYLLVTGGVLTGIAAMLALVGALLIVVSKLRKARR